MRPPTLSKARKIRDVAIVGFGIMGQGIAQAFAQSGFDVKVFEVNKDQVRSGLKAMKARLRTLVRLGVIDEGQAAAAAHRVRIARSVEEAVTGADLVEEIVPEDLALKRETFRQLDELCGGEVILASCTSSLLISEITTEVSRKNRCVGTHWFNPAYLMPLVEVIRTPETSEWVVKSTESLLGRLGKSTIVCKDSPGFVANRIQHALNNEAMLVFQEGLATSEDIDKAVRLSFGLRLPVIGPLKTLDLGGLDTALRIREYMQRKLRTKRFRPPKVLRELAKSNRFGLKSGAGFYDYEGLDRERILRDRDESLIRLLRLVQSE